jgi:hypothetical protein
MTRLLLILFLVSSYFVAAAPDGTAKVETVGALTEATVAEPIRASLSSSGYKVSDKGKVICEVWFRKEIATESRDVSGAVFGQIPEGGFVGVIHFAEPNMDFRGQTIKAGYYTLRYALILEDGNHQGVSPGKDFVLLAPVSEDKDPNAKIANDQLLKLSRAAAGTAHPSPWSMVPVSDAKNLPHAVKNEHDHVILETTVTTKAGPLQIGLIVFGKTEG